MHGGDDDLVCVDANLLMSFTCPRLSFASESQSLVRLTLGGLHAQVCSLHPRCGSRTIMSLGGQMGAFGTDRVAPEEDLLATANCPNGLSWFVAHTRPRCEKKFAKDCAREGRQTTLPCYRSVHRYHGKTATFEKPLFPGYAFLFMERVHRQQVLQNQHVANLLEVFDQALFVRQLEDVMRALEAQMEIWLVPQIGLGQSVRIKAGPLRGLEGWVEARYGMSTVLLRLDFIGQAAAVKVHADELELI